MVHRRPVLRVCGQEFPIDLALSAAPKACAGLLAQLPFEGELIHAAWSGPLALVTDVNLANAPMENPVAFLSPVTITYHPTHHDLGFAYRATLDVEPRGPAYVSLIGSLAGDIQEFINICIILQKEGSKKISIEHK